MQDGIAENSGIKDDDQEWEKVNNMNVSDIDENEVQPQQEENGYLQDHEGDVNMKQPYQE